MRVIGLTGGIGAGKSTVARLLGARGAVVVDADALAREVLVPGSEGLAEVVAAFGRGVLGPEGALDRAALGQRVFSDPEARARLEAITHPRIYQRFRERVARAQRAGAPLTVFEAALLVDARGRRVGPGLDGLLWVSAEVDVRLRRVQARDGLTPSEVRARMAAQVPDSVGRRAADWVIWNDGDLAGLEEQVEAIWEQLVEERHAAGRR